MLLLTGKVLQLSLSVFFVDGDGVVHAYIGRERHFFVAKFLHALILGVGRPLYGVVFLCNIQANVKVTQR